MDCIPQCHSRCFHLHRKKCKVSCEQIHVLLPPSLQFSCWWVDIMLSIDDICILMNMVLFDPIQANLVSHVISSHVRWSQWLWFIHRKNYILWLTPNTCISNFFHSCVNMAWWAKGTKVWLYRFYVPYIARRCLVALQRQYVTFILRCVIIVCEGSSKLITL